MSEPRWGVNFLTYTVPLPGHSNQACHCKLPELSCIFMYCIVFWLIFNDFHLKYLIFECLDLYFGCLDLYFGFRTYILTVWTFIFGFELRFLVLNLYLGVWTSNLGV